MATLVLYKACWCIVDGKTVIALGALSIPQAAIKLHDYKMTWKN
jgi:hypothetical protein